MLESSQTYIIKIAYDSRLMQNLELTEEKKLIK